MREALRRAAPVLPAVFAVGASFGVLARTAGFGSLAAIVMSMTTFAGSAQIATVSLLGAGSTLGAAIAAAVLLNMRYGPIGISVARAFRGSVPRRFVEAQLVVDESWALSQGRRRLLVGIGGMLWIAWVGGTTVGVALGSVIGDPGTYGIDGAFAALFVALLATQLRTRRSARVALVGAVIAAALVPFTPPGIPIVVATVAVLA